MVFGLCSLLIPAGYSNDSFLYQLPNQSLLTSRRKNSLKGADNDPNLNHDGDKVNPATAPATIGEADEAEDEQPGT